MDLTLISDRLIITPLELTDVDLAVELWTDPEVVRYICDVPAVSEIRQEMPDADIEVGYFLKPSAWGRGYATEVCERMLQFAFQEASLSEVVASVHENNVASKKVLEKCGFLHTGRTKCWGKESPIYRITSDEWIEIRQST
ncbi:GNAT family N-acetyltransferase [Pseudomonadota bacterium]